MNAFFLSALQHYGYPALWVIVFAAAAGAPISGSLLLFAAGAFAAFGDFNLAILFLVAFSAAVMGDNLGYYIGRRVGSPLLSWFGRQKRFRLFSSQTLIRALEYFRRRTGWAIFVTRFLIVVLGGPINFLAGVEQYPYRKFLFWDIIGQFLGAVITLGLGFLSAESWEEVATLFGAFSSFLLAFLIALAVIVLLLRKMHLRQKARAIEIEMSQLLQPQQLISRSSQNTGPIPVPD